MGKVHLVDGERGIIGEVELSQVWKESDATEVGNITVSTVECGNFREVDIFNCCDRGAGRSIVAFYDASGGVEVEVARGAFGESIILGEARDKERGGETEPEEAFYIGFSREHGDNPCLFLCWVFI